MPKVSVIVPVYNTEKYVERAIVSLMEQTIDDVEFIIIDDGSNDSSLDIIKQVVQRYPMRQKQSIIISRENRGVALTRTEGMELVTGDYVIHLDSDDWAEPTWLEALYNRAIQDSADVVICDFSVINNKDCIYVKQAGDSNGQTCIKLLLLDELRGYTWNKLISSRLISRLDDPFKLGINYLEDYVFSMMVFNHSTHISYVSTSLYNYNQQNLSSITKSFSDSKVNDIYETIKFVRSFLEENNIYDCLVDYYELFKIKQKCYILYNSSSNLSDTIWDVYPSEFRFLIKADVSLYFKLCILIAGLGMKKCASYLLRGIIKIKKFVCF